MASRPSPIEDALAREWLAGAREGRLLIQRCAACERFQFYPRAHCAHCFGEGVEWHQACGRGTLYSYTVVRYTPNEEFAADCPYVFALVDLEEGVRVSSRVVGASFEELRCDLPVALGFEDFEGVALPVFAIAKED